MRLGEITVEHTTSTGHRIVGHKGKCAQLHGHTYRFVVELSGEIRDPGFVCDFGDIKDILNEWDHKLLIWAEDPFLDLKGRRLAPQSWGIVIVPFNPTAENMAEHLTRVLVRELKVRDCQVTVWETPKSSATAYHSEPVR